MKLKEHMTLHGLDNAAMALRVNQHLPKGHRPCTPHAIKKWKYEERTPRKHNMSALTRASNGEVTANDFTDAAPAISRTPLEHAAQKAFGA